jgi:hypothetical protein
MHEHIKDTNTMRADLYITFSIRLVTTAVAHNGTFWRRSLPHVCLQVLGWQPWSVVQQKVLDHYHNRCAVSTAPAKELSQSLRTVPQWQFDYHKQQVQLAAVIPICEPMHQLTQLLAVAAGELAHLSPSLQLPHADVIKGAGASAATLTSSWRNSSRSSNSSDGQSRTAAATTGQQQQGADGQREDAALHGQAAAVHAAHAEAAAAAVAGLPAERQEAFKWLAIYQRWHQVDCVRYVAYAGWRQQQLLQENWQLVKPDASRLAEVLELLTDLPVSS